MTRDRISIENRLTTVEADLRAIMTNHLPHIQLKVDRIQWLVVTTLVSVLSAISIAIVTRFL